MKPIPAPRTIIADKEGLPGIMTLTRFFLATLALALIVSGCKKEEATAEHAAQMLQESFASATPEVKQSIATASSSLKEGNFAAVARELTPIVTQQQLTVEQQQAVSSALVQINQAITANPDLDSKELYELRARMFESLRRGPRF
jgi:PBP1b-binding outer membrane lipoprotein LpoB